MLSNAYLLAKFRFDTAENEPAKNLQKFANMQVPDSCVRALLPALLVVYGVGLYRAIRLANLIRHRPWWI